MTCTCHDELSPTGRWSVAPVCVYCCDFVMSDIPLTFCAFVVVRYVLGGQPVGGNNTRFLE